MKNVHGVKEFTSLDIIKDGEHTLYQLSNDRSKYLTLVENLG